jgi:hypothetical protein
MRNFSINYAVISPALSLPWGIFLFVAFLILLSFLLKEGAVGPSQF